MIRFETSIDAEVLERRFRMDRYYTNESEGFIVATEVLERKAKVNNDECFVKLLIYA